MSFLLLMKEPLTILVFMPMVQLTYQMSIMGYQEQVLAIQLKWSRIVQVSHTNFLCFKTKLLLKLTSENHLNELLQILYPEKHHVHVS